VGCGCCCDFPPPRAQREKIYVINDGGVQAKEIELESLSKEKNNIRIGGF
jgi:hypothetical protein